MHVFWTCIMINQPGHTPLLQFQAARLLIEFAGSALLEQLLTREFFGQL